MSRRVLVLFVLVAVALALEPDVQTQGIVGPVEPTSTVAVSVDGGPSQAPIVANESLSSDESGLSDESVSSDGLPLDDTPVQCRNASTGQDSTCWQELQLSDYLRSWARENPCREDEPFSGCFTRKHGLQGYDCVKFSGGQACPASIADDFENDPEVYYVVYNMWSMNYFFSRFADAADGTLAVVNSRMGIMQRLFNPTRRHFDVLQAMLVGLSLGTAFLFPASITTGLTIAKLPALTKMGYPRQSFGLKSPPPGKPKPGTEGGGGRGPSPGPGPSNAQNGASWKDGKDTKKDELDETKKELPSYTDPIAISLMEGFGGSLAAARAMFPRYTFDSQREQTAKAEENVAILTQELVTGFHETLKVIESDMESFIAFASTGAWSAEIPDAFDMRGSMTMSMMTFMITSMLNSNNIHGVVGLNTDPVELATNGSQLEYPIDCTAYDEYGMCDGWWYSPDLNAAFSLVDMDGLGPGDQNKNTHYRDHLQYLFSNNLTTGENLFLSAWDCMRRQSQVSDWLPSIGASPGCMSTLQLHFWDMSCDTSSTTGPVNTRSCEFTDRKPQIGFGARRGGLEHFLSLPPGYLGPHIYKHRSSAWKISRGNLANNTKGDIEKEDAEGQVM